MTLTQIRYFEEVCCQQSIAGAAEKLFVSRSVISRSISELEEEFETKLFVRSKNGVELTASGKILRKLFSEFSGSYKLTKEYIHQLDDKEDVCVLKIGITPTNGMQVYQRLYDAFTKACPDIQLYVREAGANDAFQMLFDGDVDLFFTPSRVKEQSAFESLDLYQTRLVIGISNKHPAAKKGTLEAYDLLNLPLGYLEAPLPIENFLNSYCAAFGGSPNVVIRTSIQSLLQELTERGLIATVLPKDMMSHWKNVTLIPLDFFPFSTHRVIWNRMIPHNDVFDQALEFLKQYSKEQAFCDR